MRPLNKETIPVLCSILNDSLQMCPPYAVEMGDRIVVTNQSWLMEWPASMVDTKCPQFENLRLAQFGKLATAHLLLKGGWRARLLHPDGEFDGVTEVSPSNGESRQECLVFMDSRSERSLYHWTNVEVTEFFVPDACYLRYRTSPKQNVDERMHMLGVFNKSKGPVGVFANKVG